MWHHESFCWAWLSYGSSDKRSETKLLYHVQGSPGVRAMDLSNRSMSLGEVDRYRNRELWESFRIWIWKACTDK